MDYHNADCNIMKKVVSVGIEKMSSPVYCVLANFPILARSFKAVNTKLSGVKRHNLRKTFS